MTGPLITTSAKIAQNRLASSLRAILPDIEVGFEVAYDVADEEFRVIITTLSRAVGLVINAFARVPESILAEGTSRSEVTTAAADLIYSKTHQRLMHAYAGPRLHQHIVEGAKGSDEPAPDPRIISIPLCRATLHSLLTDSRALTNPETTPPSPD